MKIIHVIPIMLMLGCMAANETLLYFSEVLLQHVTYSQMSIPVLVACIIGMVVFFIDIAMAITKSQYIRCIIPFGLLFLFLGTGISSQLYAEKYDYNHSLSYNITCIPARIGQGILGVCFIIFIIVKINARYNTNKYVGLPRLKGG